MGSKEQPQESAIERLLRNRLLDSNTGCWLWTGTVIGNGYGYVWCDGEQHYVHRLSASIFLDFDLKSSLYVLHTCDEPACFNPSHLYFGTQKDNMRDAKAKGRLSNKKLTEAAVSQIKYEIAFNKSAYRPLALRYGVTTATIGQIARKQIWRDVEPAKPSEQPKEGN